MQAIEPVERRFLISSDRADRLRDLSRSQDISEDELVERALDLLLGAIERDDPHRGSWSVMSSGALRRVWDNEDDARYDDWRKLYGVPSR